MKKAELVPGDWVVYTDPDNIQWGPWEITHILYDRAVVSVDRVIEYPIPYTVIRKVDPNHPGNE
tara:strand:+ start:151 stop:342 length:192 start_codon:yes stop_codon:yes gene_type:complete